MAHRPADDPSRRAFLRRAALALGAPALSGCGMGSAAGTGSSPEHVEYVVVADQEWTSRAAADLTAFAATDPGFPAITRDLTRPEYESEAAQLVFGAEPPALMWHNISRARFADIVASGAASDLTGLWAEALPDVPPDVASWYTAHGRKYAVPLDVVLYPLICYDVALFRRLGITPPSAATRSWHEAEFLAACAALHAAGLDPLALGGLEASHQLAEAIAVTMLSQDELRHYTVDGWQPGSRFRYTDEAWVQVFAHLQKWFRGNVFQPRAAWAGQVSAQLAFVGGVSGMVCGGSSAVRSIKELAAGAGVDLEFDWMLVPTIRHPSRLLSFPGNGVFIPAASAHREQAKQLLAFMLREDRRVAAAKAYGHIPAQRTPGLDGVLDARVLAMLEVSTRLGAPCMNWPTEMEARFARVCRAVVAGTSTPREAGQDMEDAASLVRAAGAA